MQKLNSSGVEGMGNKVVFLDVGGTLVDFQPPYHRPILETLRKHGFNLDEKSVFRAIARQFGNNFKPNYESGLLKPDFRSLILDLTGETPSNQILEELERTSLLGTSYALYSDSLPFLRWIKESGFKVVLVTNASPSMHRVIKELGVFSYIEGLVASCDLGVMKPHPDIFKEAAKIAGPPLLHIGDTYEVDYVGAKNAGYEAVLVDRQNYYDDVKAVKVRSLLEVMDLMGSTHS